MITDVMLITAEKIRELGYVHDNVLPKTIKITIKRAQRTMLRPIMGADAYDTLIAAVSASLPPTLIIVPLTADQIDLIDNYIQPYLAACVDYKIVVPLTIRHKSKSVGKGKDENHDAASKEDMIMLKNQMQQDVDAFAEILIEKLASTADCEGETKSENWGNSIKFR